MRLYSLLHVRLRLTPLSVCRSLVEACKENEMTTFGFEGRNSGSSMGVGRHAEMGAGDHFRTEDEGLNWGGSREHEEDCSSREAAELGFKGISKHKDRHKVVKA